MLQSKMEDRGEKEMTIREAGKGIVITGGGYYLIGYVDEDGDDAETCFYAYSMQELHELYRDFCKENKVRQNTVRYITHDWKG